MVAIATIATHDSFARTVVVRALDSPASVAADWLSASARVSGAQAAEASRPTRRTPAAINVVAWTPSPATLTGSRNVPIAAPIRLNAVTTPMPEARTLVGNSSLGYTTASACAAETANAKTAKSPTTTEGAAPVHTPRAMVTAVSTRNEPRMNGRRFIRLTSTIPATEPTSRNTFTITDWARSPSILSAASTVGKKVNNAK